MARMGRAADAHGLVRSVSSAASLEKLYTSLSCGVSLPHFSCVNQSEINLCREEFIDCFWVLPCCH